MSRHRIALLAAALCVTGTIGLAGCAPSGPSAPTASPRVLTSTQAEELSMLRFRNYDAGVRGVSFSVTDSNTRYTVTGWVDFTAKLGYAIVSDGSTRTLAAWNATSIATYRGSVPSSASLPPLPPPGLEGSASGWETGDLSPRASRLYAALSVLIGITSDRPDNPLLLQQTDARWVRDDTVDGTKVMVVDGPTSDEAFTPSPTNPGDGRTATVRYWIDRTGLLHRMEMRLGGGQVWTTVDFSAAKNVSFAAAFAQAADGSGAGETGSTGTGSGQ